MQNPNVNLTTHERRIAELESTVAKLTRIVTAQQKTITSLLEAKSAAKPARNLSAAAARTATQPKATKPTQRDAARAALAVMQSRPR